MHTGLKIVLTTVVVTAIEGHKIVTFVKRVGVLRQRTCGLFLQLFTLSAVLFAAFYLFRCVGGADAADLEADYINLQDLYMIGCFKLGHNLFYGDHSRWWLRLAHLLSGVALGSLTYTATTFAAVGWHSGKHRTLSSFLRKAKSNLLRPALTVAGVCALRVASIAAVSWLIGPITGPKYMLLVVVFLVFGVITVLKAVCAVAVVASVAEPGLCGKLGAVPRACRLMRGNYTQTLDIIASQTIQRIFWLLFTLVAMAGLPASDTVKCLLLIVQEVISVAHVTGYYFQYMNRVEKEDKAGQNKKIN